MRLCNRVMRAVRGYSFGHAVARHAVSRTSIGYFIGWTLRSDDVTAQHRMQRGYAALNTAAGPHLVLLNRTLCLVAVPADAQKSGGILRVHHQDRS